jgi:DNA-binding HxlR family transcriptional regulator
MVLLDVLGQRWTLRVLWELSHGRATFRVLRSKCDEVSPTLLNKRLKDLRDLAFVDLNAEGFGLTRHGISLTQKLATLDVWAEEWAHFLDQDPRSERNPSL